MNVKATALALLLCSTFSVADVMEKVEAEGNLRGLEKWTYDPWGPNVLHDAISCDWTTNDNDKERCEKHCAGKIQPPCCKPKVEQCGYKLGEDGMCHLVGLCGHDCPHALEIYFHELKENIWPTGDPCPP